MKNITLKMESRVLSIRNRISEAMWHEVNLKQRKETLVVPYSINISHSKSQSENSKRQARDMKITKL